MGDITRIVIFDTTLRDGEQAPGFSHGCAGQAADGPRARRRSAWTSSKRGSPSPRRPIPRPRARWRRKSERPVIAALARCRPADIDEAADALRPAERRRIHTFLATSDLHLEKKLRITRDACLEAIVDGVRRARNYHRRRRVFGRRCDAQRSRLPLPRRRSRNSPRRDDHQPAGHRGLRHAGRHARVLRRNPHAGAELRQGDLQHALPRRPRPGGRQQPGGHSGRRTAGRVHHQRHRRARWQRVARRARDGASRSPGSAAVRHGHQIRSGCSRPASCSRS